MPKLLLVDDEANVLYSLQRALAAQGIDLVCARTAGEGIAAVESQRPDAVVLDVKLPDLSGLDAFERMKALDPRLPVIIITAHTTTETAIEAMKRGAFEYLLKPLNLTEFRGAVEKALELSRLSRVPAVFDQVATGEGPVDRIVGRSPPMQTVYKQIGRVAPQDVNVLILGESGTGKELVARAIFQHSRRATRPFLAINCAAIPEALLESELFGHERGAFTGADHRRIGKFEQADGGTIFLDEIGDMSPATQSKILRLLQDGAFERVGGNETLRSDVRVIAATNCNLDEMILDNRFRQDLFYRLNTFTIRMPSLRDRMEDLPLLVEHFVSLQSSQLGKSISHIAPQALRILERHRWPGNVRELQSAIKYALVRAAADTITPECLPDSVRDGHADPIHAADERDTFETVLRRFAAERLDDSRGQVLQEVHDAVDRVLLEEVLRHAHGNQVQASELLGISRTTFRAKLHALGIKVEKTVVSDAKTAVSDTGLDG